MILNIDRLLSILEDWSVWMKKPSNKLGFPSKSLVMINGGYSGEDSFDNLISIQDKENVKILDTLIHDLPKSQKQAIYYKYLNCKKPFAYEYQLELAMDNLLTLLSKKINA